MARAKRFKRPALAVRFAELEPSSARELSPMVAFIASEMDKGVHSGTLLGGTEWAIVEDVPATNQSEEDA